MAGVIVVDTGGVAELVMVSMGDDSSGEEDMEETWLLGVTEPWLSLLLAGTQLISSLLSL